MSGKREGYLTWDEYFMSMTALSSLRSPYSIGGACLVDQDNRILSIGYNDIAFGIKKNMEIEKGNEEFVVDSLSNALYTFSGRRKEFENGTLYLTSFPDYNQSRQIAQAKLKKVVFSTKLVSKEVECVSNHILYNAGVEVIPYYDDNFSLNKYKLFLKDLKNTLRKHIGKSQSKNLLKDEYFMSIASLSALRSKDPSTQVGACLIDKYDRVLSIAYNGAPVGMKDDVLPWNSFGELTGDLFTTKDPYIVHAEINVFDNYRGNQDALQDSKLYLVYSPCVECSKRISSAGLERVIYLREYTKNGVSKISNRWLNHANTISELYIDDCNYSKEQCLEFFDETTKVIKKHIGKPN